MTHDDRIDVFLGFSKDDAIKFHDDLLGANEFTFRVSDYRPQHIVLDGSSKSPLYRYVSCRMLMRTMMSLAASGMRGESAESITVLPPMIRMNTKDVFERNCRRECDEAPDDAAHVLASLLALGNVHVMEAPVIKYGDRNIGATTVMYGGNEKFIKAVKDRISLGHQVFLYNYKRSEISGHSVSFWRWTSVSKD